MDSTLEEEGSRNDLEIVRVGERFLLFDPHRTVGNGSFVTRFILDSDALLKTEIIVYANQGTQLRFRGIAPFNPEEGYQVTHEDLKPDTRNKKLEELLKKGSLLLQFPNKEKASLSLSVHGYNLRLEQDVTVPIVKRLRLQLFFPNSTFEGRASSDPLFFSQFYPQDTGPLPPVGVYTTSVPEGFDLYLPADQEKLSQIEAKFIILQEDIKQTPEEPNPEPPTEPSTGGLIRPRNLRDR